MGEASWEDVLILWGEAHSVSVMNIFFFVLRVLFRYYRKIVVFWEMRADSRSSICSQLWVYFRALKWKHQRVSRFPVDYLLLVKYSSFFQMWLSGANIVILISIVQSMITHLIWRQFSSVSKAMSGLLHQKTLNPTKRQNSYQAMWYQSRVSQAEEWHRAQNFLQIWGCRGVRVLSIRLTRSVESYDFLVCFLF